MADINTGNRTSWPLTFASGMITILDLHGKNINRELLTATSGGNVITVNGILTLKDSSANEVAS